MSPYEIYPQPSVNDWIINQARDQGYDPKNLGSQELKLTVGASIIIDNPLGAASSPACSKESAYLFFGQDGERAIEKKTRESEAKNICGACAVQAACLTVALKSEAEYGVWGNTTESERKKISRLNLRSRKP